MKGLVALAIALGASTASASDLQISCRADNDLYRTLVDNGVRCIRHASPSEALSSFEAYLRIAPKGELVEEARWGRIEALRELNRSDEEADALAQFLEHHPDSLMLTVAQRRLTELRGGSSTDPWEK